MATGKKKIIVYSDWKDIFSELKDADAGKLIKLFFAYVNDESPEEPTGLVKMAWIPIKAQLKRDLKKWEQYIDKQKENGKKGGRPENPNNPSLILGKKEKPKKADTVIIDTVIIDTVKDKDSIGLYRQFAHLKISETEVSKLLDAGYSMHQIDEILDSIQNYKNNKKYTSLYLTAKKWLKKDKEAAPQKTSKLANADAAGERVDQKILEQLKASM